MTQTRRRLLRGLGLAAAAAAGASVPTTAQSEEFPHWDAQPDHVTLTFDEPTLLDYAPRLIFEQEAREKFQYLRGWTASSPEYDYDWHVFVALYTNQEGVLGPDSHLGDTEWYYVASDPDTGAVEQVVFDAYHWLAGKLDAENITLDDTNPVVDVVSPWHPFSHTDVDPDAATTFDTVGDMTETFDEMLADGLAESLQPGTVVDPATMAPGGRTHWWRNDIGEFSFDAAYAETLYSIGLAGADEVDSGALSH